VFNSKTVSESGTLFDEETMPSGGGHGFYFVGKEPLVMRVVTTLLFVNTFLLLVLDFGAKYFLPKASLNLQPCEALAWRGIQYQVIRYHLHPNPKPSSPICFVVRTTAGCRGRVGNHLRGARRKRPGILLVGKGVPTSYRRLDPLQRSTGI
jgi:hypothetical protein